MSPLALSVRFLQKQPDSRLTELAAAGHERAFEALVQRYRRALLGYCRRFFPSDAASEDVLQQALLQAWIALRSADAEVKDVRPWLYRIVHNAAISNLRRRRDDSFLDDAPPTVIGPDEEMERRLAAREALAGLAALPEPQRQVMFGTAVEGRSHEEIAAGLGLSQGAVRGLIYRARATLRSAAAALVPTPLVHWALRHGAQRGSGTGRLEAIAGGSSAGLAGSLLKGGAVVISAGAIVTAAGITSDQAARTGEGARHLGRAPGTALAAEKSRAASPASSAPGAVGARAQGDGRAAAASTTDRSSGPPNNVVGSGSSAFNVSGGHPSATAGSGGSGTSGRSGGDQHGGGPQAGSGRSGSSGSSGGDGRGGHHGSPSDGGSTSGSTSGPGGGTGRDGGTDGRGGSGTTSGSGSDGRGSHDGRTTSGSSLDQSLALSGSGHGE